MQCNEVLLVRDNRILTGHLVTPYIRLLTCSAALRLSMLALLAHLACILYSLTLHVHFAPLLHSWAGLLTLLTPLWDS